MIFVDARFYVRYLVQPVTLQDRINERRAAALFALLESGAAEITTSEAILAEDAFILTSPRHYAASRATVVTDIKALLRPRGCRMPGKAVVLRDLDSGSPIRNSVFPTCSARRTRRGVLGAARL